MWEWLLTVLVVAASRTRAEKRGCTSNLTPYIELKVIKRLRPNTLFTENWVLMPVSKRMFDTFMQHECSISLYL